MENKWNGGDESDLVFFFSLDNIESVFEHDT